jgi:diguanylate cyclase (GGDEF)-like protein
MVNLLGDPDVQGVVVNLHDITERKQAEDALSYQAFHDALTGLANRALFHDRVEHALQRDARQGADSVVIYIDLDGFKTVNDSLGHEAGDHLIREVAARLSTAVRGSDTVARLGGDEFAILLEHNDRPLDEAVVVAERVLEVLCMPVQLGDNLLSISASLGIAAADRDSTSSSLLRNADIAMYRAKIGGRGRWVVFDPAMRTAAVERVQLESDLRTALEEDQVQVLYQPVVGLETHEVTGFEAVPRWEHPVLGAIEQSRFMPIADEASLSPEIARRVIHSACHAAARWHARSPGSKPVSIAVSLSSRQLSSPDLVTDVAEALAQSGLTPSSLVLEMNESVLLEDPAATGHRLNELRALGVRLGIDDFGTGYSALNLLRQLPIDVLKVDRSFISTISDRSQVPGIVRGLLDLGRSLHLETVTSAEGMEAVVADLVDAASSSPSSVANGGADVADCAG